MKDTVYNIINSLENDVNNIKRRKGMIAKEYANSISCFYCLDTKKMWKERNNLPWDSFDGRGSYDIIKCRKCCNGGWIKCSHSNTVSENGIKIYKVSNTDCYDRVDQLFNKGSSIQTIVSHVDSIINAVYNTPENEQKPLFEVCKTIKKEHIETSLDGNVEVGKIVDIVKNVVEAYFGDIFPLINLTKELTVSFSMSDSKDICYDQLIKIQGNNYLGIKTSSQVTNKKLNTGLFGGTKYAKEYKAYIFIIKPQNASGVRKAQEIMNGIGSEMIENIMNEFNVTS